MLTASAAKTDHSRFANSATVTRRQLELAARLQTRQREDLERQTRQTSFARISTNEIRDGCMGAGTTFMGKAGSFSLPSPSSLPSLPSFPLSLPFPSPSLKSRPPNSSSPPTHSLPSLSSPSIRSPISSPFPSLEVCS